MRRYALILLFSFTVAFFVFLSLRYIATLSAKTRLLVQLDQTKKRIDILEGQLGQQKELGKVLLEEKVLLEGNLKEAENEVVRLNAEKARERQQLFSLIEESQELKRRSLMLQEENAELEERMSRLSQRTARIEAFLKSVPALARRMASRLKIQEDEPVSLREGGTLSALMDNQQRQTVAGNLGFLIRNGLSTYRPQVKIEVRSAQ